MTNLVQILMRKEDTGYDSDYIIAAADGEVSDEDSKSDNCQKILVVNDGFLLPAGDNDTIEKLIADVSEGGKDIMRLFVSGKDERISVGNDVELMYGMKSLDGRLGLVYLNKELSEDMINHSKSCICTGGSGSDFASAMVFGADLYGIETVPNTLAEGLLCAYELSMAGTADLGVDHNFQFGILSEKKIATIFHPEIELREMDNYLSRMLGSAKNPEIGKKIMRDAYYAMIQELADFSKVRKAVYKSVLPYINDDVEIPVQEYKNRRCIVEDIAAKFADPSLENMMAIYDIHHEQVLVNRELY